MKNTALKAVSAVLILAGSTGAAFARKHDNRQRLPLNNQTQRACSVNDTVCYRFLPSDREELLKYYQTNWMTALPRGDDRIEYVAGQQLDYMQLRVLQTVPIAYTREITPPPAGYQFGYFNGAIYAYNPATGIVADGVDLVTP